MRSLFSVFTLAAGVLLAGCQSQLLSRPDGYGRSTPAKDDGNTTVTVGIDYGVPMLQFDLTVQRQLIQCVDTDKKTPKIRFMTKVVAEPHYVVGERFVVDYEKLSAWSKITKFELQTFDNGVIKSMNADAEDKSASIIGDVVKSGVSLLSLASGVPLPKLNASQLPPGVVLATYVCSPNAQSAVTAIADETKRLKAETQKLVGLTDEVARLERSAGMGALGGEGKKKLDTAQKAATAQSELVDEVQKSINAYLERVSVAEKLVWPLAPQDTKLNAEPNPKNTAALQSLFVAGTSTYSMDDINASMKLRGAMERTGPMRAAGKAAPKATEGLLYRSPVAARLTFCQIDDDRSCTPNGASNVVLSSNVMAPQLGELRLLPFSNGIFQSNILKVTFRENGSIATLNYDERTARGAELAGAVAGGLDQLVAYRDARVDYKEKKATAAKQEVADKKQAELDVMDHEIARLEKVKKINGLVADTTPNTTLSDLQTEEALLNAKLAVLEARKKVKDAQASLEK